jgi:hypothetical protein
MPALEQRRGYMMLARTAQSLRTAHLGRWMDACVCCDDLARLYVAQRSIKKLLAASS